MLPPHTGWRKPDLTGYVRAGLASGEGPAPRERGLGVPRGSVEGGARRAGERDFGLWPGDHLAWFDQEMFVSAEALVDMAFPAALAGLADMARGGLLTGVSHGAYGDGFTGMARVGPLGEVPGMSKLVQVQVLDLVTRGESAVLALRWQATGPGGRLFPALDADIWLTPAGERSARLSLAGVYRPPLGALGAGLDRAVFHRVADATVRSLLARVADVLARPQDPAATVQATGIGDGAARRAAPETP